MKLLKRILEEYEILFHYNRYRSCTRKKYAYDTEDKVAKHASHIGFGYYKCRYCNKYHLTSNRSKKEKTRYYKKIGPIEIEIKEAKE